MEFECEALRHKFYHRRCTRRHIYYVHNILEFLSDLLLYTPFENVAVFRKDSRVFGDLRKQCVARLAILDSYRRSRNLNRWGLKKKKEFTFQSIPQGNTRTHSRGGVVDNCERVGNESKFSFLASRLES